MMLMVTCVLTWYNGMGTAQAMSVINMPSVVLVPMSVCMLVLVVELNMVCVMLHMSMMIRMGMRMAMHVDDVEYAIDGVDTDDDDGSVD